MDEQSSNAASLVSIFAIIVIYKQTPALSPSLQTLIEAVRMASNANLRFAILIADNTPGGQTAGDLPDGVRYRAFPENPGLARPYNEALQMAEAEGFHWLLTLDQDTHLPANFLVAMQHHARKYESVPQVGAIVPRVMDQLRPISPFRYAGGFLPRLLPPETSGLSKRFTSAINSTSLFRVSTLRQIGGYEERYPLHNSDTSLYQKLDEAGWRVAVVGDLIVQHELGILQRESRMSADRYKRLLEDECDFWDRQMGVLGRTERLVRLMGRAVKGYLHNENKAFRTVTIEEFWRRLSTRKRTRMRTRDSIS